MTKKDIVEKIVRETGFKHSLVGKITNKVFEAMISFLLEEKKIEIRNFGVFQVKIRRRKIGRNPRTNKPIPIPDRKVVTFKPGLELKKLSKKAV